MKSSLKFHFIEFTLYLLLRVFQVVILKFSWNYFVVFAFGLPQITFLHAVVFHILISIIRDIWYNEDAEVESDEPEDSKE